MTGGFSRSAVNFDAGADTQMASILTALGIGLATLYLTPVLYFLPKAALAATIIVAVLSIIDWRIFPQAYRFSSADFMAVALTVGITLAAGVELGVLSGVAVSLGLYLYQTSKPHFAIVGQVGDTEHYRNIDRHNVTTFPEILSIRVDESLYFANAGYLEEIVFDQISKKPQLSDVVLMCPAVNMVDMSALDALKEINARLCDLDINLHLSEVKGPVMDALQRSDFLQALSGEVFLSHHAAVKQLRSKA